MQDLIGITEGRFSLAQHQADFNRCVQKIRHMAGLPVEREIPIRQAVQDDILYSEIFDTDHRDMLREWPLRNRIDFLDAIRDLPVEAKSVRIYAQAYALLSERQARRIDD